MKCVLLAAGYATRLYPLTLNTPKPLLPIGGKTILDFILDKIEKVQEIDEVLIVTNATFIDKFVRFKNARCSLKKITCLNDGSTTNENRLGAIADLAFAVHQNKISENTMALAGDNLFDFELTEFSTFYGKKKADCITTHRLENDEALRRTGVIEIDSEYRVLSFEEKPKIPKSQWAVPPFYLYRPETLGMVDDYLRSGGNPDAPGNLIPWLLARKPVYAFPFLGKRYDIGDKDSYAEACRIFSS